jgi:hypothetical protein
VKKEYLKPELVEYEELRNLTAQELTNNNDNSTVD